MQCTWRQLLHECVQLLKRRAYVSKKVLWCLRPYVMPYIMPAEPPPSHMTRPQAELGSPALAFVKLLVHLLSLDSSLSVEVGLLRRRLLRLVGVDEFSPAAVYVDPCMSFRLHDIICRWALGLIQLQTAVTQCHAQSTRLWLLRRWSRDACLPVEVTGLRQKHEPTCHGP